jgi:hypothetical protein
LFAAVLLITLLTILVPTRPTRAADPPTTISGGDLPRAVRLAFADEDAFFRRLDPPHQPEETPPATGPSYVVSSVYWDRTLREDDPDAAPADMEAVYFPQAGYARARQAGEEVWLLLNQRQRAIVDRYIRLAREGLIGEAPGVFDVVRGAARSEPVTVMAGNRTLTDDEAARFWQVAQPIQLRRDLVRGTPDSWPPPSGPSLVWIVLSLPEGRSVDLLYSLGNGVLIDRFATELYPVPSQWLVPVLGPVADISSPDFGLTPAQIEHDEGAGSQLWWVVMLGGGLGCLAAALWLRRRPA